MDGPDAEGLLRQASQLFRAGRAEEALPAYERLLAVRPDLPASWFNLAMLQRGARRFDDALASYGRALDLGIDRPEEVHLQRGVIFADDLGLSDDARAELDAALALNPAYVPALLNLGNLHEDRGEWTAARAAYDRALALDPSHPLVLARLAGLADIDKDDAPLLARIEAAIAAPGAAPADRADLGFALGAARDRIGAYDAAFAAYAAANRASRIVADAAGLRYVKQEEEALVDRLIAAFPVEAPAPAATAEPPPIFICGMFRSGSTLAEHILARHSRVVAGGELDLVPAMVAAQLSPYPEAVAAAPVEKLETLRDAYLAEARRRHPPDTFLTDKRPDNVLHIGLIKMLFPNARIVHTVRDARDNCLSVYFLHAGPQLAYATDLGDIAHHYREQRRLMAHWRACYPDDIFELDYDRLVAAPRPAIEALLGFCGLPWEEAVLDRSAAKDAIRTPSHRQVRQPLYRGSSGRWRNYRRHLDALATI